MPCVWMYLATTAALEEDIDSLKIRGRKQNRNMEEIAFGNG